MQSDINMSPWEWYIDQHYIKHCIICDKPIEDYEDFCTKHSLLFPLILLKATLVALVEQFKSPGE